MANINWGWTYRPRVQIGSVSFDMPLPIMQNNERYSNDMKQVKVPLQNGVIICGVSRGALQLSFNGSIAKNTLSGVLQTKDALIDLFYKNGGLPFTFYRYYDAARGNYRWFENCVCNDLNFSSTNKQVYTLDYSLQFSVPSGVEKKLIGTYGDAASIDGVNKSGRIYAGQVQGDEIISFVENADELPEDRTILYGPLIIKLPDSNGDSSVMVMNGDGDIVFKIDSAGRVKSISPISLVRSIEVTE